MKLKRFGIEQSGVSPVLYHLTSPHNLIEILRDNKIHMTSNVGTHADKLDNGHKFKPYFFAMSRVKYGGFTRSFGSNPNGLVNLVINGVALNQKYKGQSIDYWGPAYRPDSADTNTRLRNNENEDRIWSDTPYLEPLAKYVTEIHIFPTEDARIMYQTGEYTEQGYDQQKIIRTSAELAKSLNILVYVYSDFSDFKVLNKRKALPSNRLTRSTDIDLLLEFFDNYKTNTFGKELHERMYRCYVNPEENLSVISNWFHNAKSGDKAERMQVDKVIAYMRKYKIKSVESLVGLLSDKYEETK